MTTEERTYPVWATFPELPGIFVRYVSRDEVPTEAPLGHLYIFRSNIPYDMNDEDYIKKRARLFDEKIFIVENGEK